MYTRKHAHADGITRFRPSFSKWFPGLPAASWNGVSNSVIKTLPVRKWMRDIYNPFSLRRIQFHSRWNTPNRKDSFQFFCFIVVKLNFVLFRNCAFGLKRRLLAHRDGFSSVETTPSAGSQHRRYFRCPAELPIGHLVKFLRSKFDVTDTSTHKVSYSLSHPHSGVINFSFKISWRSFIMDIRWLRNTNCLMSPTSSLGKRYI